MKKSLLFALPILCFAVGGLASCGGDSATTITVAASESPHAQILNGVVADLVKEQGYTLNVTVLDWTIQNEGVYSGDYDANYFQHRPYLQQYDANDDTLEFSESYTYTKVFPVAAVHFEPLRIYPGKSTAADFESKKTTATYCICNDSSNASRALQLLADNGIIDSSVTSLDNLPSNITPIAEENLASSLADYDYGVLPANTALTGKIAADTSLPVESNDVRDLRANVVAASVSRYANDSTYKTKIDVLANALLDDKVASFIASNYNNVVADARKDYR